MDDKCIAAYVREKRPEILSSLDFIMYSLGFRVREFAKEISQVFSQIDLEELKNLELLDPEELKNLELPEEEEVAE